MAILKHFTSKNADYGEAQRYLMFQYDEAAMKPVLDESGRMIPREEYYLDGIPLLFPTIEEATLLALDAMVCVALAVPAAVFFPFSLPGMPFDIGVSARISAGFPFLPSLRFLPPVPLFFHWLPVLSHAKDGLFLSQGTRIPADGHFSYAFHGLSGASYTGGRFS